MLGLLSGQSPLSLQDQQVARRPQGRISRRKFSLIPAPEGAPTSGSLVPDSEGWGSGLDLLCLGAFASPSLSPLSATCPPAGGRRDLPCPGFQSLHHHPPHGLWSCRLLSPRVFPGKNAGVDCRFPLQGIFQTQGLNPRFLCLLYWQGGSVSTAPLGSP